MDNGSHNFQETPQNQQPQQGSKKSKNSGWKLIAIVAIVAALIGGGVGGGTAYWAMSHHASLGVTDTSGKAGTTKISNVSVNQSSASEQAFAKVKGAVVSVVNMQKAESNSDGLDTFGGLGAIFGQDDQSSSSSKGSSSLEEASEGSGVIYQKKDGKAYIVTNNHVVSGSDKLEVILSDGTKLTAKLVGTDPTSDLAVLTIDGSKVNTVASFGDSSKIEAGQTVLAIGSPLGSQYATSVTQGIVSAKSRTINVTDSDGNTTGQATVIQTDAAINSGNSGGPLINLAGQVIGINSMKLSGSSSSSPDGATIEGMGFAIPSDEVVSIINQLVQNGKVVRPALGIEVRDLSTVSAAQQKSVLKLPSSITGGVVVAGFTSGSSAKLAGIKKYDVITALDGVNVNNIAELHTQLYKHKVGDTIKLTVYREGQQQTVSMKLTQTTSDLKN
ncbi:S1C family serine protease [Lacticaseibacillus chiayiensis]|uniref:Trypsin-like peptidase domain-containing protein n=1 Tax=Lacticaseibacillus chiayiensis TaxID=2100821 RepID=A0ABY6H507_9LACO|nr:trypsin-like peptidase domain-containing protein [Lacticaseibacillus chiayiensis]QVI34686.1 trypsin-like peptidase domain-containing protein [Lacticaseibacillus chiayiensis]UYN56436.1 trypsin-like peptidase domain-containing protein [Lacticaseibacillus chiayiensis]